MTNLLSRSNTTGLAQFIKYSLVGLINTAVTAFMIWRATQAGFYLLVANAIGYATGIALSLILNTFFTFDARLTGKLALRFLTTALISYLANLLVIAILWEIMSEKAFWIQAGGMVTYTALGFLLNKWWVMKP